MALGSGVSVGGNEVPVAVGTGVAVASGLGEAVGEGSGESTGAGEGVGLLHPTTRLATNKHIAILKIAFIAHLACTFSDAD